MSESKEVIESVSESTAVDEPVLTDVPAEDEVPDAPVVAELPGHLLREAREARHLTVFEVAQSLKFSPRQIEAIEADDYAVLPPGTTFRRGFVRGYAKLLKLDPVPLLALLDVQTPVSLPDVRAPQNMGVAATPTTASRRSSKPMLLGSAALTLVVLGLAAWHFLATPSGASKPTPAVAVGSETTNVPAPQIRIEDGTATAEQGAMPPIPADMRQLVFVFQDKSWVEVKDATQRIIYSAENLPGTRQAVVGKPPFQVVVGNAAAVELQYEDRQVDLKPYIRAEVARLTVE